MAEGFFLVSCLPSGVLSHAGTPDPHADPVTCKKRLEFKGKRAKLQSMRSMRNCCLSIEIIAARLSEIPSRSIAAPITSPARRTYAEKPRACPKAPASAHHSYTQSPIASSLNCRGSFRSNTRSHKAVALPYSTFVSANKVWGVLSGDSARSSIKTRLISQPCMSEGALIEIRCVNMTTTVFIRGTIRW